MREEENYYTKPIEELDLSSATLDKLKRAGFKWIGDLQHIVSRGEEIFIHTRDFDRELLTEVLQKLTERGYWTIP